MVLVAWFTLPFIGLNNLKKFFPAAFFTFFIELLTTLIGKKRKWWVFHNKPNSVLFGEFPFLIGPFMASSLWILKWTYGNLKRFLLINAFFEASFTFLFARFAKKIKYWQLVRFNGFQFFLYYFLKAFLLYGFQYYFQNKKIKFFNNKKIRNKYKSLMKILFQQTGLMLNK